MPSRAGAVCSQNKTTRIGASYVALATGPESRSSVPIVTRAIVLAASLAAVVIAFVTYVPADIGRIFPPADIISNTWHGPLLIITVPFALGWLSLAFKRKWLRVAGLTLSILVLLICLDWIYIVREMTGTLPDVLRGGNRI
jgi:hypothetical protein